MKRILLIALLLTATADAQPHHFWHKTAMPQPDSSSGKFYRWIYGFLHLVGGNLDKVLTVIKPSLK